MTLNSSLHSLPSAGVIRRLAAMVYDSLVLMALTMAYGAIVLLVQVKMFGQVLEEGEKAQMGPLGFVGMIAVIALFYCLFWRRGGQTIGMRAWRLQIIGEQTAQPSWRSCLLRCLTAPLSLAALGAGYWWCLVDKQGATLHDRASATRVVLLPKSKK